MCLAEHHVPQEDLEPLRADLGSLGWRTQLSKARTTGRSEEGTTGGTAVLTLKHVALDRFPLISKFGPGVSGHDWCCVALRCRGATVLLCSLYLTSGLRLSGENQRRFQSLSEFLRADGRPFVLLADWNVTQQKLAASRWPEIINWTNVCPKDTSFTCTSGPGRLIDFAFVRLDFAEALSEVDLDSTTPWAPHSSIVLQLNRAPRNIVTRILRKPSSLVPGPRTVCHELVWKKARTYPSPPLVVVSLRRDSLPLLFSHNDAQLVSCKYTHWSSKAEKWLVAAQGLKMDRRWFGGGQHVDVKCAPFLPRRAMLLRYHHSAEHVLWAAMAQRLTELEILRVRGHGLRQQRQCLDFLCKSAPARLRHFACSLENHLDCLQLMVFASQWTLLESTGSFSDLAREALQKAKVASQHARSHSIQKIRHWARFALCGSAGDAHHWIKKPEQASSFDDDLVLVQDNDPSS